MSEPRDDSRRQTNTSPSRQRAPAHVERPAETREGRSGVFKGRISHSRCVFVGALDQIPEVRRFIRLVADGHEAVYLAELVACELAADSVLHTRSGRPGGWFMVEAEFGTDEVTVSVLDLCSEREPEARPADTEAVGGRGLWMVELLSLKWGFEYTQTGRRVWAVLPASGTLPDR